MPNYSLGTDAGSLSSSTGGVNNIDGQPLLAADNSGSKSRILGQALQREILDGVANGDFAFPPSDAGASIDDDTNPLPYWSYTGATGFTATIATETTNSASGNALQISVGTTAVAGTFATLSRYVPISNSGNRNYCYNLEVFEFGETGTVADRSKQKITITTTAVDKDYAALTVSDTGIQILGGSATNTIGTGMKTPDARAAYLLVTLKFELITSAVTATTTYRIGEVRLNRGQPEYALSSLTSPSTSPWYISNTAEDLDIRRDNANTLINLISDTTTPLYNIWLNATDGLGNGSIDIESTTINLLGTNINAQTLAGAANTINASGLTHTGDIQFSAAGSDIIIRDTAAGGTNPRILFRDAAGTYYTGLKAGAANVMQVLSGTSTTTYGQLWADRIYPMNGSTASRYIFDNGSQTAFSGAVLAGAITSTGVVSANNFTADTITGTTATTNAAIWVLTAGTTYNLRRNTSSARYKTNIVDVDQIVIDAAKRIKPRHFESTIADETGATRLGFIAEEVHDAGLTHAVGYDAEGRPETIDSVALIAALYARVEDLERRLGAYRYTEPDVPRSSISD